jgi:hypothetical protein
MCFFCGSLVAREGDARGGGGKWEQAVASCPSQTPVKNLERRLPSSHPSLLRPCQVRLARQWATLVKETIRDYPHYLAAGALGLAVLGLLYWYLSAPSPSPKKDE